MNDIDKLTTPMSKDDIMLDMAERVDGMDELDQTCVFFVYDILASLSKELKDGLITLDESVPCLEKLVNRIKGD